MDIITAQGELAGAVATKQKEIDALNLASTILSNTFAAEFTARDQALTEMSATYKKLDDEKNARTNDVATLTSEKSALSVAYDNALAEKDALITESAGKDTQIEDLQAQVEALTPPVEEPIVEEVAP